MKKLSFFLVFAAMFAFACSSPAEKKAVEAEEPVMEQVDQDTTEVVEEVVEEEVVEEGTN